jgi:glycogen debranching enzyme
MCNSNFVSLPRMPYRLFTLCMSLFIAGCAGDTTAQHQRPSGASLLPAQYRCTKFCTVDFLRNTFRVPRHGLLIGRGAILTEYADWTLVDYDSRSLTRIRTVVESNSTGQFQPRVVERSDTSLSQKEMAAVQTSADRIWASAGSVPTQFTYHRVWNIYLLDGETVRSEFGPGNPDGLGRELQGMLDGLWNSHQ